MQDSQFILNRVAGNGFNFNSERQLEGRKELFPSTVKKSKNLSQFHLDIVFLLNEVNEG